MKKYFLITIAAAVLTGCFSDPVDQTPVRKGQTAITLDFEVPEAPEIGVATRSAADDAAREGHIVRLDIFAFDENGDIVAGSEGHKTMNSGITTVNGRGRAQVYVTIPPSPGYVWRQFYVVANGSDALLGTILTKADLEAVVLSGVTSMPYEEFVMSGNSALNKIDTANPTVNMSLRRMVSRVDVVLADAVANFEITRARLINARNGGYVYEHLDAQNNVVNPAGSALVNYGFVAASEASHSREFNSLLYCCENYDAAKDDATTTAVIIGGIYKGQEVFYRVNLHDNAAQAQVRRNYAYKVRILSVNGPGNSDPDAAILDAPQNIDYEIVDWDYSLHCDVVYDGKHYLGLSRSDFTFGKGVADGTATVVTNLEAGDVSVTECDANGNPATHTWLDGILTGSKITVSVTQNDETSPRAGYLLVQSASKPRLKLIIKVQQYHSDDMLMRVSPTVIMAPTAASTDKTSTVEFMFPTGTEWMIESVQILEDTGRNWFRMKAPYDTTGAWIAAGGTSTVALGFEVDAMNPEFTVRTAVVTIRAKYGAIEEKKTITVSQANATEDLSLGRYYIGKTGAPAVEKVSVMSYAGWTAYFATINEQAISGTTALVFTKATPNWVWFADENYNALTGSEKYETSSSGSGNLYIVFDQVSADQNAYIIVESGGSAEAIRLKRFTQQVDKINGYETMELPHHYQWGRRPDGYETASNVKLLFSGSAAPPATLRWISSATVKRQPRYGDPAYAKPASPVGTYTSASDPKTCDWLTVDNSITPSVQRDEAVRWDAAGVASDILSETNLTGRKSEFDPCPDGWRVPTAREMENIFVYGPNRVDASAVANQTASRNITSDDGRDVKLSMNVSTNTLLTLYSAETSFKNGRSFPYNHSFWRDDLASSINYARKFYWTSTMSASGGPYAFRMMHNDQPEVFWTIKRPELNNAKWPAAGLENTASMMTQVRCVRDNQTAEELIVNRRRLTVDYEAQNFSVELAANNIESGWTATSSDPSWLVLDGQSAGADDATISMRVTQNNGANREGYIRITTTAGSVANIVVRQTDHTGVCVRGLWMMDRNMGATRSDHDVVQVADLSTIGYYYAWGTNNTRNPFEGTGSGGGNSTFGGWDLSTQNMVSNNSLTPVCYPYSVKNEINDPCPEGWRVMAAYEWNKSLQRTIGNEGGAYIAQNTQGSLNGSHRYVLADNGRRVNFPLTGVCTTAGVITGNAALYATPQLYHSVGAYYTTLAQVLTVPSMGLATGTSSVYKISDHTYILRCAQDIPDDWEEYSTMLTP